MSPPYQQALLQSTNYQQIFVENPECSCKQQSDYQGQQSKEQESSQTCSLAKEYYEHFPPLLQVPSSFLVNKKLSLISLPSHLNSELFDSDPLLLKLLQVWEGNTVYKFQSKGKKQENPPHESSIDVIVPCLPFFWGEFSSECLKNLCLPHQFGEVTYGMHLCLNLHNGPTPVRSIKDLNEESQLAVVNYSINGWALRMKLQFGRRWLLSNGLTFQIDPPESSQTQDLTKLTKQNLLVFQKQERKNSESSDSSISQISSEQFYSQHNIYLVVLTQNLDFFKGLAEEQIETALEGQERFIGKLFSWSKVLQMQALIINAETLEIVKILKPGKKFKSLKFIVFDRKNEKDVTKEVALARKNLSLEEQDTQDEQTKQKGVWELCFEQTSNKQNIYVWAANVVTCHRKGELSKLQVQATYFLVDTDYDNSNLQLAPVDQATGLDILMFGTLKFQIQMKNSQIMEGTSSTAQSFS